MYSMNRVERGRPHDACGRAEREMRVYDFLDKLNIAYDRLDHEPAVGADVVEEITRALSPAVACKNLFLTNSKGDAFYLLVMRADKHFVGKVVARQIGSTRLSFADEKKLYDYLGVTTGSVSVMCLINDAPSRVRLLVDYDVYRAEYMRCHPSVNTSSLRIRTAEVFGAFTLATRHDFTVVRV